eukprot:548964-Amorphochlora_amoeboformis.AAC.1
MWANSDITRRWVEIEGQSIPHLENLEVPKKVTRKRRRIGSGPELATPEQRDLILGFLKLNSRVIPQGSWQCKPAAFGRLVINSSYEGVYASGQGRLYDFKVLKNKAVTAKWTRYQHNSSQGLILGKRQMGLSNLGFHRMPCRGKGTGGSAK